MPSKFEIFYPGQFDFFFFFLFSSSLLENCQWFFQLEGVILVKQNVGAITAWAVLSNQTPAGSEIQPGPRDGKQLSHRVIFYDQDL